MSEEGFEFVAVSKSYAGKLALAHASLRIQAGPHTAILGPSGCGKSTVLRLLAGLETPTDGSILLDGQAISTAGRVLRPPHQRGVAMLFQDLALWPNLTTCENVRLGLAGLRLGRHESSRRTRESLELCGIADLADRLPSQLSGGQQQRAALARAMAVQPRFLLLDEPFSGVDLAATSRLLTDIAELARQRRFQVVLVSHDPWEAVALCETAIVLDQGMIRAVGKMNDLLKSSPWEPFASFRRLQDQFVMQDATVRRSPTAKGPASDRGA